MFIWWSGPSSVTSQSHRHAMHTRARPRTHKNARARARLRALLLLHKVAVCDDAPGVLAAFASRLESRHRHRGCRRRGGGFVDVSPSLGRFTLLHASLHLPLLTTLTLTASPLDTMLRGEWMSVVVGGGGGGAWGGAARALLATVALVVRRHRRRVLCRCCVLTTHGGERHARVCCEKVKRYLTGQLSRATATPIAMLLLLLLCVALRLLMCLLSQVLLDFAVRLRDWWRYRAIPGTSLCLCVHSSALAQSQYAITCAVVYICISRMAYCVSRSLHQPLGFSEGCIAYCVAGTKTAMRVVCRSYADTNTR